MIKFIVKNSEGRTLLGIVLFLENVERLVNGDGIHIPRETVKAEGIDDIYINFFPTPQHAMEALKPLFGEHTEMHIVHEEPEQEQ